ncbi:MAG: Ig-like domain-containing protein [Chloroflexota bacterium]
MRKFAAAALAVPVLAMVYGPVLARRMLAGRIGLGVGSVAISAIVALGLAAPNTIVARPPVTVTELGPAALAGSIEPHHGLREPVRLSFSDAMDPASVAAALRITPTTDVSLAWDATGRALTIAPKAAWKLGAYYTVTIAAEALDRTGHQLAGPARSVFTTRGAVGARITAVDLADKGRIPTATSFVVAFDGPVDESAVERAFHVEPAVEGTFATATTAAGGTTVTFQPTETLASDTVYTVSLIGSVPDRDGAETTAPAVLTVQTAKGPGIVRFRPFAGSTDASRTAPLSVRFTARMDRASTEAAFSARIGTKKLKGTFTWADRDTVLVFKPAAVFAFEAKVIVQVATTATDRGGTPLALAKAATFKVEAKPRAGSSGGGSSHIGHGSGIGAGTWHAVELYYLKLMNCTRGGGWVTSGGDCSSPGGSGISALILHSGISREVSRPYAKYLVSTGICSHFADGDPGVRLRRAGYAGDYRENLGCRSAPNPFASVLGTHLYFQSEKPCGGYCHYANMMSPKMKYAGIGVWVGHGRVRLVIDFWEG